jgi:hypothetical protein
MAYTPRQQRIVDALRLLLGEAAPALYEAHERSLQRLVGAARNSHLPRDQRLVTGLALAARPPMPPASVAAARTVTPCRPGSMRKPSGSATSPAETREARMFIVMGATGHVGSAVAACLLAQRHLVTVVTRDATRAAAWAQRGAQIAVADLQDVDRLRAVFRN